MKQGRRQETDRGAKDKTCHERQKGNEKRQRRDWKHEGGKGGEEERWKEEERKETLGKMRGGEEIKVSVFACYL